VNASLQVEPWDVLLAHLHARSRSRRKVCQPVNPRPRGQYRPGSATEAVLHCLAQRPGRWLTESELVKATGRSRGAVTGALFFLRGQRLVRVGSSPLRGNAKAYSAGQLPASNPKEPDHG